MLTTALLLMLAADVRPAFLSDGAPRSVRLIADAPPPPSDLPSYSGWTRSQLRAEYDRLAEARPGIGLPIALMSSGGGALVFSLYLIASFAGSFGGVRGNLPGVILFSIVGTAGAAMLAIGGILLSRSLPDRKLYGKQMDEVERLRKEREREREDRGNQDERRYVPPPPEPIIGPPPEGPPPLPLPPMPNQGSMVVLPLLYARF